MPWLIDGNRRAKRNLPTDWWEPQAQSVPIAHRAKAGREDRLLFELNESTLSGLLVGPPAQNGGAVAEASAREVVV